MLPCFWYFAVNKWSIAVGCEWILFSTWVFVLNCFLKVLCNNFSLFFLVNSKSSCVLVLIRSSIFGFWHWISFITLNILEKLLLLFSISLKRFSNFYSSSFFMFRSIVLMISLRSLRRLLFVVLLVTFSIFSLIFCHCLHNRVISSFTWKRCFGFFPRMVSAVLFIAWAISSHLLSLMFGSLCNFTSSSFWYWSATTLLSRLSRFTCALYFILGRKDHFILHDIITSL